MRRRLRLALPLAAFLLLGLLAVPAAQAAPPAWRLTVTPKANYFPPAPDENAVYTIEAENIGGTTSSSQPVVLEDVLPPGLAPFGSLEESVQFYSTTTVVGISNPSARDLARRGLCPTALRCEYPGPLAGTVPNVKHGEKLFMLVRAAVPSDFPAGPIEDKARISGGGALAPVEATASNMVGTEAPYGFSSFEARLTDPSRAATYTQAGGRPYQFSTEFNFTTLAQRAEHNGSWASGNVAPAREVEDVTGELPPGLVGNPQAVPHCVLAEFFNGACETKTMVGFVGVRLFESAQGGFKTMVPLYNLQPQGEIPGLLGFLVGGSLPFLIETHVRSGSDYGLDETGAGLPVTQISRIRVTVWGVPAEHSHDGLRGKVCGGTVGGFYWEKLANSPDQNERECEGEEGNEPLPHGGPAGTPPAPFLRAPTECSGLPLNIGARTVPWGLPEGVATAEWTLPEAITGCNQLSFEPTIEAHPTTNLADAPTGLEFHLHIPQHEGCTEEPSKAVNCEIAAPDLKESVVKLPAGLSINPSSANGLAGCSPEQIGLRTPVGQTPAHFTEAPANCPDASKIGLAEVKSPLLHEPLGTIEGLPGRFGAVYLATPHQNPFDSLLAAYIVLEGQGIVAKLPGEIEADPATGQLTGRFTENPQQPFEDFRLKFFEGAQGDLRTPSTCGTYETSAQLTPYSHMEGEEEATPIAEPTSQFELTQGSQGGTCLHSASEEPNAPLFRAGTESTQAGKFTPFGFRLAREDGSQEIGKVETSLPPGLTARLAGVAECSEAQIAVAQSREHEGGGAEEKADPACPASSEVGEVQVASGAGPTPLYVHGKAYLAGPYKGAPLSLEIITPAVAGPFDLGDVAVRTALYTDPYTAQIKAVSDSLPHILQGIPLDVRSITLKMSRPGFTLNPTNCEEMGFAGAETSLLGNVAPLSQRFQVGGCQALPFKPKLAISLKGGVKRHTFPALSATLTMPPGQANVASAQVTLPHNEQLEQGHITSQVCLQAQLATRTCPKASIYGYAKAETPLLDHPLEGPVYLGVGFGHKLPDLVAELNGQIRVLLHGKVDTGRADGIRNTFEVVPDAPVSKFTLHMFGGKKGLIVNSENLCGKHAKHKALATFTAQSGKTVELEPTVKNSCKKKHGKGKKGRGKSGR